MATRMQQRRGTAAQWISTNGGAGPVLNAGEIGWESDTNKFKIGDGTNNWTSLDYFSDINSTVNPAFGSSITFEGATANDFETTFAITDPTADRTLTFPDATGTVALTSDITVTASSTNTLTNKTLTSPKINEDVAVTATATELNYVDGVTSAIQTQMDAKAPLAAPALTGNATAVNLTVSGNLTVNGTTTNINSTNLVVEDKNVILGDVETPTDTTADGGGITLKGTTDKTFNWVDSTDSWTSSEHLNLASGKAYSINGTALKDVTETLTNKTLTSPTLNNALSVNPILRGPEERWSVSATAATGTIPLDILTSGILYYTTDASANWTLNIRGNGSTSLNDSLVTNDSITVVFFVTNGATPYYQTGFQIDGSSVTPKWQNGTAPSAGNANSIDIYSYTIVKTGSAAFTAFGSQTKFA
jgi:hypothetical protein